jgi:hypothetical protein
MGFMVQKNNGVATIAQVIGTTLRQARQRTDFVRERVEEKLGPYEPILERTAQAVVDAEAVARDAQARVDYLEAVAHRTVGEVRDEVRNALGRPARHDLLDMLFPQGISTVTEAPVARAPVAMGVIAGRMSELDPALAGPLAARLPEWAARLTAAATPLGEAVEAAARTSTRADFARADRATAVRAAWVQLPRLKRRLRSDGLTEAQVHEVIPAMRAPNRRRAAPAAADLGVAGGPSPPLLTGG